MPQKDVLIGRIGVKVLPDTDDFKQHLKRQLEEIERTLDPLKVKLELEQTDLSAQVKEITQRAKRAADEVTINVDLDGEQSVRRGIAQLDRELEKLRETEIKVALEEGDLESARDLLKERLDEIARVELSVDPKSRKSIERAIQQLDRELEKVENFRINVETDEESLRSARDNLQREIDKMQYALDHEEALKINFERDTANRINRDVQAALNRVHFDPQMDQRQVRKSLRDIEKHLLKISDLRMSITPEMNERERREVYREIEDLEDKVDEIKSSIEPDVSQPHRWAVQENLARLTRPRTVHIIPVVSNIAARRAVTALAALSTARAVTDVLDDLYNSLKDLDKKIITFSKISLAVLGLGSLLLTSTSNILAFSESLAQIVPAALALPGILGGVAIGVGATIAVFKDFNKELPYVAKNFKRLQGAMSEDFWNRAKAPIKQMIDRLFPQFADGMEETSMALGTFFGNLAKSFEKHFDGALDAMFNNLELSISKAAQHTDAYAGILETLGRKGSEQLPRLADWFGKISDQFDNFLAEADADGRLDDWINTGIFMMKELGRVIKELGGIFYGLAQAAEAAGGSTLTAVADTLERVSNVVNGPTFQKALTGVFEAAHQAMTNLADKAGPSFEDFMLGLANTLQKVLPIVGSTLGTAFDAIFSALDQPAVWRGVVKLFKGIEAGIEGIAPAMPSVGKAFGKLLEVMGTMAETLGPVLGTVLGALADALVKILPALEPVIVALGDALLSAIEAVAPLLPKVTEAIVWLLDQIAAHPGVAIAIAGGLVAMSLAFSAISSVLGPLMPLLAPLVELILPALSSVLAGAAPFLFAAAVLFGAIAVGVGAFVAASIPAIAKNEKLRDTLKDLWENVLVPVGEEIWNQAKKNWPAIKDAISGFADAVADFWEKAEPHLTAFKDWLVEHMPEIKQTIGLVFGFMTNQFKICLGAFEALVRYMTFNIDGVALVVETLWDIISSLNDFSSSAREAAVYGGRSMIEGLAEGMYDGMKYLNPALAYVFGEIADHVPHSPPKKGPLSGSGYTDHGGRALMEDFAKGMEERRDKVLSVVKGVAGDVSDGLTASTSARIDASLAEGTSSKAVTQRILNYHAAQGNSLDSEEDLFEAADRVRMVDW